MVRKAGNEGSNLGVMPRKQVKNMWLYAMASAAFGV
jgi:hypothetical protein